MARKKAQKPPFTVLRDSKEHEGHGWLFPADPESGCLGTTVKGLPTGDYSLEGFEKVVSIERKRNTGEFAMNASQDRFERELARLQEFPVRFVVLEFTLDDIWNFPANSGIPRSKWRFLRTTPDFLLKRLVELSSTYEVPFVPCGRLGREFALSVFKRVAAGELPAPSSPPPSLDKSQEPCPNDTPAR